MESPQRAVGGWPWLWRGVSVGWGGLLIFDLCLTVIFCDMLRCYLVASDCRCLICDFEAVVAVVLREIKPCTWTVFVSTPVGGSNGRLFPMPMPTSSLRSEDHSSAPVVGWVSVPPHFYHATDSWWLARDRVLFTSLPTPCFIVFSVLLKCHGFLVLYLLLKCHGVSVFLDFNFNFYG